MKKFSAMLLAVLITFSMFSMNFADAAEKQETTEASQSTGTEIASIDAKCSDVQNAEVASGDTDFSDKGTGNIELTDEEREKIPSVSTIAQYKKMAGIPNLKNSAQSLPANVDNSQSKYFPPVGDQGGVGACCSWANIYYQMSYMENRALDRTATYDNSMSPLWVYNYINSGIDMGSTHLGNAIFASTYGVPTLRSFGLTNDYKPVGRTHDAWKEAQKYKIDKYYEIRFDNADTIITSPDDSDLDLMKTALSNGEILTFSTYVSGFYVGTINKNDSVPENSKYEGQHIAEFLHSTEGSHRMTIVGYNDNLWVDINKNGVVEDGEKGAFKIVNSWGESYYDDGFIWVSYDSLNRVSSVDSKDLSAIRKNYSLISDVMGISVKSVDDASNINLEYTVAANKRDVCQVYVTADNGKASAETLLSPNYYITKKISYDGSQQESYATYSLDLSRIVSDLNSDNLGDYKFSIKVVNNATDNSLVKISDLKIVDYNYDREYYAGIASEQSIPVGSASYDINTYSNNDKDSVTIYYSGYSTPYIHYQVDGQNWTNAPGYAMATNNDLSGFTHIYTISLNGAQGANVCFNDGNGNWDSCNGANYRFDAGTYKYCNGNKEKISSVDTKFKVKNFSSNSLEGAIYTNDSLELTANGMNGKEPYQYQFGYYENGKKNSYDYQSQNTKNIKFENTSNITPFVNIKDADNNVVTKTLDDISVKKSMKIDSLSIGTSYQPTGDINTVPVNTPIYLLASISNGATKEMFNTDCYNSISFEVKKRGHICFTGTTSAPDTTYQFNECGKYTIIVTAIDFEYQRDVFYFDCYAVDGGNRSATIYSASPEKYRIDYIVNGYNLSQKMNADTTLDGCPYMLKIDLGQSPEIKVHFVDSNGVVHDDNGSYFDVTYGDYLYKDGKLKPINVSDKELSIDSLSYGDYSKKDIKAGISFDTKFSVSGGVEPYTYEISSVNGDKIYNTYNLYNTYNSGSFILPGNLYQSGTYYPHIKVTDALGNVVEKTGDDYITVIGLKINNIETSVASPQYVGTPVKLNVNMSSGYYTKLCFDIKKDGALVNTFDYDYSKEVVWYPDKTGIYTITAKVTNAQNEYDEYSQKFIIIDGNLNIIDYSSSIYDDSVLVGVMNSFTVTANGGAAPYQYQFGYIFEGETFLEDYSTSNEYKFVQYKGGDYQYFVTVKDANGNTASRNLDMVHVKKLSVTAVNTSLVSPQPAETAIKLSAEYENARSMYGSYGECTFTIKKDNVITDIFTNSMSITPEWTPTEPGNYTITYYMRDIYGQTDSKTVDYTVTDKLTSNSNIITVFYSGYDTPNIHYMVSPGIWTAVPGVAMTKTDEQSGYTHKYTVNIGERTSFTCCFNDNNNNWDSLNGFNYTIDNISGNTVYGIKNGSKNFISQSAVTTSDLVIDTFENSSDSIGVSKTFDMNVSVSGGTAPYTYQFGYIKDGVRNYLNLNYRETDIFSYSFSIAGKYSTFVNVRDSKGNFVTKTSDLTVIDDAIPVEISLFTASSNSAKTGDTVRLSAYGKNGTPYYTMKYSYEINGVKTYINEEPTSYYCVDWTPNQAGVYTLLVELYDINNNKAEAAIYNYVVTDSSDTAYDLNMS